MTQGELANDTDTDFNDTLTVVKFLEGSYPNFFLEITPDDIGDFADRFLAIRTDEDYERFVETYGIRRTNPAIWTSADWFQERFREEAPLRAGLFDLNRYRNR